MSRRRRRDSETIGDILSEGEDPNDRGEKLTHRSVGSEGSDFKDDLDVSEYESLDEETRQSSDEEEQLVVEPQHQIEVKVVDKEAKAEDDTKPQRESGDGKEHSDTEPHTDETDAGQESSKNEDNQKEEDDPAFIPTKGAFFQHDMRSDNQPKGRGRDRKIWDREPVKWKHDMFVMEEQMPKSRDILISNYGYDIRDRRIGVPPPSDARRIRGRGRGGGYRGRGGPQSVQSDQRRTESTNENRDSKEEYPAVNSATNHDSDIKHKSKFYYKRDSNKPPVDDFVSRKVKNEPESSQQKGLDTSLMEERKLPSKLTKTRDKREDEKMSDILEVINNRGNTPSSKEPMSTTTSSNSRRDERQPKNYHQSTTFSNYQEAPKPRRYSSLRQRQTNSPVDKQSSRYSPRSRDDRYANFSKPVQPSQTVNFTKKSLEYTGNTTSVQNQTTPRNPKYAGPLPQTTAAQPTAASVPHVPATNQQPVVFSDPSIANMGAPLDQSLMQMPLQYNPMLNPMYEAAAYQRMMQMMSQQMLQMNMNQLPQLPTSLPPHMDSIGAAIPPVPLSPPYPSDMRMNPLMPPVSQGTLGSVMRPPLNPPAYFSGPMGMNMGTPRQSFPYPHPLNLVAQQVGGVTYFNTPTQPNNQASPRRNAAIPILAPTGWGPPGAFE